MRDNWRSQTLVRPAKAAVTAFAGLQARRFKICNGSDYTDYVRGREWDGTEMCGDEVAIAKAWLCRRTPFHNEVRDESLYEYVNNLQRRAYPVGADLLTTTLTANVAAGQYTIPVVNDDGFAAGQKVIFDPDDSRGTMDAAVLGAVTSNILYLTAGLRHAQIINTPVRLVGKPQTEEMQPTYAIGDIVTAVRGITGGTGVVLDDFEAASMVSGTEAVGQTIISLATATGFLAEHYAVFDPYNWLGTREVHKIESVAGNNITLTEPLVYRQASGTIVGASLQTAVEWQDISARRWSGPGGGGTSETAQYKVKERGNDYVMCHTWDGETEGADDIYVAKPYLLRKTPLDGKTRNGITYDYSATIDRRTATKGVEPNEIEETQIVVPSYLAGDIITAIRGITGGTEVFDPTEEEVEWLDLNADGRAWMKEYE